MSTNDSPGRGAKAGREPAAFSVKAFFTTYFPALILGLGAGVALPAVPSLAKSFDVGFGVASGVVTAHLLGNLAGTIPTGWMIDRFGGRKVMIAGPLLTAITAVLVAFATSFTELLILRFLGGWAAQMWFMARLAAISHGAASAERGRQVTWMYGMDNTGGLAGPLIGGFIASGWGIVAPFVAYGAVSLLALVPALLYPDAAGARPASPGAKAGAAARPLSTFAMMRPRLPYFGIALFAGLTRGPVHAGLLYLYAVFAYGLDVAAIGYLATVAAFVSWPIGFAAGWLMDRFGRKWTMVPGFGGVGVSMLLLAACAFAGLPLGWFVALFFLAVALQALTGGSIQTIGADVAPPEARGKFLGVWRFIGQGGQALSPIVFGFVADHVNYGSAFLFTAAAGGVVAFLVMFRVPETRGR